MRPNMQKLYKTFKAYRLRDAPTVQHSTTVRSAHTVFMCFVFIWKQTATCATYSINWLVFITEMKSVYSAVRPGSLNRAVCASSVNYFCVCMCGVCVCVWCVCVCESQAGIHREGHRRRLFENRVLWIMVTCNVLYSRLEESPLFSLHWI